MHPPFPWRAGVAGRATESGYSIHPGDGPSRPSLTGFGGPDTVSNLVLKLLKIDHVCLNVADPREAAGRYAVQFGLEVRETGDTGLELALERLLEV